MGSNRGRKAGGGSQDFSGGLKYNSRLEVGEGWGTRGRASPVPIRAHRHLRGALGFARAPLYDPWVAGARVHRWNFLFGGCLAAGGRAGPVGPRPQICLALATEEAGSPRARRRRGREGALLLPPVLWLLLMAGKEDLPPPRVH